MDSWAFAPTYAVPHLRPPTNLVRHLGRTRRPEGASTRPTIPSTPDSLSNPRQVPNLFLSRAQHFVDVRDVALAHLAACTNPAANGRRFVLAGGRLSYTVASQILASEFPEQAHRLQLGGDLAFGETFDWEDSLM